MIVSKDEDFQQFSVLQRELADPAAPRSRPDHLCLMTILGDARVRI